MQLNVKGRTFDNPKDIAEKVDDFFVNIGPDTEKEIPKVLRHGSKHKNLEIGSQFQSSPALLEKACSPCTVSHRFTSSWKVESFVIVNV